MLHYCFGRRHQLAYIVTAQHIDTGAHLADVRTSLRAGWRALAPEEGCII